MDKYDRNPPAACGMRNSWDTVDRDAVVARYRKFRGVQARYESVLDDDMGVDDRQKLEAVLEILEGDTVSARERLENSVPASLEGVALLLRHALSMTDDAPVANVLKGCLKALMEDAVHGEAGDRPGDIPDDAFDAVYAYLGDPIGTGLEERPTGFSEVDPEVRHT